MKVVNKRFVLIGKRIYTVLVDATGNLYLLQSELENCLGTTIPQTQYWGLPCFVTYGDVIYKTFPLNTAVNVMVYFLRLPDGTVSIEVTHKAFMFLVNLARKALGKTNFIPVFELVEMSLFV